MGVDGCWKENCDSELEGLMGIREDQAAVAAVVGLLEDWAAWQKGFRMKLGYPTKSAGMACSGASSFEDLCDESDNEVMRKVDACVSDLPAIQGAAVLRRYGVAAVFRFPRANYEDVLCDAHLALMGMFAKKGVATA